MDTLKSLLIKDTPVGISIYSVTQEAPHFHEGYLEIVFCFKGNAVIHIAYEDIDIQEGDIISMDPGDIHCLRSDEDNLFVSFYFNLNHPVFKKPNLADIFFVTERYVLRTEKQDELQNLKNLLLTLLYFYCFHHEKVSNTDNFTYLANEIMQIMLEHYHFFDYCYSHPDYSPTAKKRFEEIMVYINKHYHEKTTIEKLSKHLNVTSHYLSFFFRQTTFMSYPNMFNFYRVYHSEKMLLTSNKNISAISYELGYSDPKFYYRYFKKWYNHTPLQHKKIYEALTKNSVPNKVYDPNDISLDLEHYISFYFATLRIPKFWNVSYIPFRNVPH